MTTEQMTRILEDLKKKGLHVSNKEAIESLKKLRSKYSEEVSRDKVREITGKVYKKHKKTLSEEVRYIRSRG
jgi:flagellar biosynthesis regulator FlbT